MNNKSCCPIPSEYKTQYVEVSKHDAIILLANVSAALKTQRFSESDRDDLIDIFERVSLELIVE